MKQIKLQVGKTYRSRRGEEIKIVRKDNTDRCPYQGSDDEWYSADGRWANRESLYDLIEEVAEVPEPTRHTFTIPDGVKEITLDYFGNRLIVEMVPEAKEPKPGDVCINEHGSVYIFKAIDCDGDHNHFAWTLGGELCYSGTAAPGRPATPGEARPLFDALKKAGKRWNPEAMRVEEIPEMDRIREWAMEHYSNYEGIAEAIEEYLKQKEDKK